MGYEIDAGVVEAGVQLVTAGMPIAAPAVRDDWETLRSNSDGALAVIESMLPQHPLVERSDLTVPSWDDEPVGVRLYRPPDASGVGAPLVLYFHGGGMMSGSVALYDRWVAGYAAESGVRFAAVDYRLAPEYAHPTPIEDCFAVLAWVVDHAEDMGVDPARIAVMGDSAGGGLAAGLALLARDRGVAVARQVLVYPMIDDRTTVPDPLLAPFAGWSYDDNYTGWHALLGDRLGGDDVESTAAPARATNVAELPPTYLDVGELDIFRDECLEFGRRIAATGTPLELHVHPGCPHGFDRMTAAPVAQRARADRIRVLQLL